MNLCMVCKDFDNRDDRDYLEVAPMKTKISETTKEERIALIKSCIVEIGLMCG